MLEIGRSPRVSPLEDPHSKITNAAVHKLDLSGNEEITELSSTFRVFKALNYLDLSNTGLMKVPAWVGEFKGLTVLNLSGTKIEDLPKELENCTNLTVILMDCPNLIESNIRHLRGKVKLIIP